MSEFVLWCRYWGTLNVWHQEGLKESCSRKPWQYQSKVFLSTNSSQVTWFEVFDVFSQAGPTENRRFELQRRWQWERGTSSQGHHFFGGLWRLCLTESAFFSSASMSQKQSDCRLLGCFDIYSMWICLKKKHDDVELWTITAWLNPTHSDEYLAGKQTRIK